MFNFRKNKSFRPRERPKKGLKNLQTVKTLTAGQNLLNSTTIKTRKQPLTVTAQFQNSLTALMDTLNQANPFFIRCIKSNSEKIPNKFDDATVVRQVSRSSSSIFFSYLLKLVTHFKLISFAFSCGTRECWKRCEFVEPATMFD